jgi:hypothetical protein
MQPDRCARFAQYGVPQGRGREHFDFGPKAEDLTWRLGFFKRQRCEEPAVARINARRFVNDKCNRRAAACSTVSSVSCAMLVSFSRARSAPRRAAKGERPKTGG